MLSAMLLLSLPACSWISDELPECPPTELRIRFEYDYNMMRSDVFKDQVRGLTVFVFDENDCFVTRKTETSPELLGTYGYEMVFTDAELQPEHPYRFVTIAWQDDEQKLLQQPGAKFRTTQLQAGDPISNLQVKLDRTDRKTDDGEACYVDHQSCPLDTLWMSRNDCRGTLHTQQTTTATANLMRHTNNLTVTLRQTDRPADIDIADFDIRLTDSNGWVNHDNSLHADTPLAYTPYAEWNTDFRDDEGNVVQRAAHADLSFPRLMYYDDWQQNARLILYNKVTQTKVADINLPDYLAQGRNSLEQPYSPQEFLDREFTYKLDFFLKDNTWEYVELSISVLSWSVRIQNVSL